MGKEDRSLGGDEMWNLAKICAIVAMCLVATGSAAAIDLSQPFVTVSVPRTSLLYLGEVWGPDLKQVGARVNAHVVANCPYHLEASFQGLRHEAGHAAISFTNMSVAINGRHVSSASQRVPIATSYEPTPAGGVDVPIDLQIGVKGMALYPAGRYAGALVITVMAGP